MKSKIYLLCVAFMTIGFFSSTALALTPMGTPRATLEEGQFRAGFEYGNSEQDIDATFSIGGFTVTGTLDDVELNKYNTNLGYGLGHNVEFFVRLGIADLEFEDDDGSTLEDSDQFDFGIGAKVTFSEEDNLFWGALFQINWFDFEDSQISGTSISADGDVQEIQIAVGPTYKAERMQIYGGPFLHYIDGDLDLKSGSVKVSGDLEQKSEIGAYIGAQFDIAENTFWNVEYQLTGDAWGIGTGIYWTF